MAAFLDTCRFNPVAGGTGDWVYSSPVTGYQSPALAGAIHGRLYKFRAESANLTQWEETEGAYDSGTGTFPRTTVLYNSSGTGTGAGQSGAGTKINFTTAPQVAIVALKEDLISIEEANAFTATQQQQARFNIGAVSAPDVIVEDQKTSGTAGGTATSGSFVTRTLNTLVRNANSLAALASNQVTLLAGTYYCQWSAPAFRADNHQSRLRNITDSTTAGTGTSESAGIPSAGSAPTTRSFGSCIVTIASSKAFELQHQVTTTRSTDGFGAASAFSTEVYSRLEITRLS